MPWGFRDQSNFVVSSVPNSMEITASNFSKQRPLLVTTGPIEFPQNTNIIRTVQKGVNVVHIHNLINSLIGSLEFFPWVHITRHIC